MDTAEESSQGLNPLPDRASAVKADCTHRQEGVDDVGLDGAERLVSDQNEDLLVFLQADEVTEPGPLSQSAGETENFS